MSGRVDGYVVVGGKYHDMDYARLRLLELLAEQAHARVKVAHDYHDVAAITASAFVVTYTCDVRPSAAEQAALRAWVEGGGRWLALHATNAAFDPPPALGQGVFGTPRCFPVLADTLGSQFLSHPDLGPYPVTVSPGAADDPLVRGIAPFDAGATEELYLCEYHGEVVPLLETRWTGTTRGFAEAEWTVDEPRLVLYRRPLGTGEVVYFTLGHCRSRWDMADPPFHGFEWPTTDRGSWEVPAFGEVLRRGLAWAAGAS